MACIIVEPWVITASVKTLFYSVYWISSCRAIQGLQFKKFKRSWNYECMKILNLFAYNCYRIVQNIWESKFLWLHHLGSIRREKLCSCHHHLYKIVLHYRQFSFADKQITKTVKALSLEYFVPYGIMLTI